VTRLRLTWSISPLGEQEGELLANN